jgi:GT2 family glycosyltransferase
VIAAGPTLTCIVVTWNSLRDVTGCLRSVEENLGNIPAELVVVDNASSDGTSDVVARDFPRWRLVRSVRNLGFAGGNNLGFGSTRAPYVMLLNPDTTVLPGAIGALVGCLEREPRVGAVGPLKRNDNGSVQPSWGRFPSLWQALLWQTLLARVVPVPNPRGPYFSFGQQAILPHDRPRDVDWLTASCVVVRRAAIEAPLFAEGNYMYWEDCDLCYRVKAAGWRVRFLPDAEIVHSMGGSVRQARPRVVRLRLRGEVLLFARSRGRGQERTSAGLGVLGCLGRSLAYRAVAAVSRGAGRRRAAELAVAHWDTARELSTIASGRTDMRRLIAVEVP